MTFAVYTKKFLYDIDEFFLTEEITTKIEKIGTEYCLSFELTQKLANDMVSLVEKLLIRENPIVKDSKKIEDIVRNQILDKSHEEIKCALFDCIREFGYINLDGFINFRLSKYVDAINNVLILMVNKNLLWKNYILEVD